MTTARITRAQCRAAEACYTQAELEAFMPQEGISPSDLVSLIGETRAGRTLTALDCHWALCRGVTGPERFEQQYRLHAVWCARRALARVKSPDPRSVEAVNVAERFAHGMATEAELDEARASARAAALGLVWDPVWDAAWDAACEVACAAASAAARDAARASARAASRDAARASARDAARASARASARDAAWDAAWAAERLEQCKDLAARLETP